MASEESEHEGGFSAGVNPISITSPNFDLDPFLRDLGLDTEFLDSLLVQLPSSEVQRVPEEQVPAPHIDSNVSEVGRSGDGLTPTLPEFYLADSALQNINVFRADFGDHFNSLTSDSIIKVPIVIVHPYMGKIRALREKQIREAGRRDSVKVSIAQNFFFLNEKSGKVYSHYLQTEMQTLHTDLENFEGVFSEKVGSIFKRVEDYNENGSNLVVLFI
jgi:hypothetical protein